MKKKILFITPPYRCGVVEVACRWVPLTFVYLAGAVRGEGEETLPELLGCLTEGSNPILVNGIAYKEGHRIIPTRMRPFIRDLDGLAMAWGRTEKSAPSKCPVRRRV